MTEKCEIITKSAGLIDLLNPKGENIHFDDICHALPRICRFNGHTEYAYPYSVAQHSCVVAHLVMNIACQRVSIHKAKPVILAALLHDATEAYMGDLASPLKKLLPRYREIEEKLSECIYRVFGVAELCGYDRQLIRICDHDAMLIEADLLMGDNWRNAYGPLDHRPTFEVTEMISQEMIEEEARDLFKATYRDLVAIEIPAEGAA